MEKPELWWSTEDSGQPQPLDEWERIVAANVIACQIDADTGSSFSACLRIYELGRARFHFIRSARSDLRRTRQCAAKSKSDCYFLLHQREGDVVVEQNGRVAVVEPGDCVLVSGRGPFRIRNPEEVEMLAVAIPTDVVLSWIPEPEIITARTLSGAEGWGRALAATLATFDPDPPSELALSPAVVIDQVLGHLAIAANSDTGATNVHQRALLRRLADTMSNRFFEPDFDPSSLAMEHGLSKRYVHMLFAKAGTSFGRELEKVRLERAKRLLEDRRFNCVDIMEIALRCGFRDSSGFSRRFRGRYGAPPSLYRRQLSA